MAGQYIERGGGRPWHKRVLIPFWLIQLLFIIIQIAVAAFRIWQTSGNSVSATTIENADGTRTVTATVNGITSTSTQSANGTVISNSQVTITNNGTIIALYSIILALSIISFLFTLVEIITFARHHLTPTKYFVFNLLKFLFWTVLFIIGIVNAALYGTFVASVVVNVIVECAFLGALIYGSVIFHRFRRDRAAGLNSGVKPAPVDYSRVQPGYQAYGPA
ncbi:hypothetical protein MMC30_001740 [Trapelia coarctata]|nr:hypothetical protein [Trapelia coarctata]